MPSYVKSLYPRMFTFWTSLGNYFYKAKHLITLKWQYIIIRNHSLTHTENTATFMQHRNIHSCQWIGNWGVEGREMFRFDGDGLVMTPGVLLILCPDHGHPFLSGSTLQFSEKHGVNWWAASCYCQLHWSSCPLAEHSTLAGNSFPPLAMICILILSIFQKNQIRPMVYPLTTFLKTPSERRWLAWNH